MTATSPTQAIDNVYSIAKNQIFCHSALKRRSRYNEACPTPRLYLDNLFGGAWYLGKPKLCVQPLVKLSPARDNLMNLEGACFTPLYLPCVPLGGHLGKGEMHLLSILYL